MSRPAVPSPSSRRRHLRAAALAIGPLLAGALAPPAFAAQRPETVQPSELAQAQLLLDQNRPEEALPILDRVLRRRADDARALFLRSTARLQTGDEAGGRADLERALQLDPGNRDAWLTRAGLEIAAQSYAAALAALVEAERLDPGAADNDVNIGAVLLLQGRLPEATDRFRRYLAVSPEAAEPYFLVAKNYAGAGFAGLAVDHLRRAVVLDERFRLRARNDPSFTGLAGNTAFQELLATDLYLLLPGAWSASRSYSAPYTGGEGGLLTAVLDALLTAGERFDPQIEVTPGWALVWGEMRIKVAPGPEGTGVVELSAPAERFTAERWREKSEALFRSVTLQLVRLNRPDANKPPA
jgi:tetratricopeptide (TPR) repeat protein